MKDGLSLFTFKGYQVRVVVIDGEPWFVVKEIGELLDVKAIHRNARKMLRGERLCYRILPVYKIGMEKNEETATLKEVGRKMLLTDRSGMFRIVLRSYKPEAQEFQHWITSEVLPGLQDTGSYTMKQIPPESRHTSDDNMQNEPDRTEGIRVSITLTGDISRMRIVMGALLGQ